MLLGKWLCSSGADSCNEAAVTNTADIAVYCRQHWMLSVRHALRHLSTRRRLSELKLLYFLLAVSPSAHLLHCPRSWWSCLLQHFWRLVMVVVLEPSHLLYYTGCTGEPNITTFLKVCNSHFWWHRKAFCMLICIVLYLE